MKRKFFQKKKVGRKHIYEAEQNLETQIKINTLNKPEI